MDEKQQVTPQDVETDALKRHLDAWQENPEALERFLVARAEREQLRQKINAKIKARWDAS